MPPAKIVPQFNLLLIFAILCNMHSVFWLELLTLMLQGNIPTSLPSLVKTETLYLFIMFLLKKEA